MLGMLGSAPKGLDALPDLFRTGPRRPKPLAWARPRLPVHSFRTLLQDLATIARTTARWDAADLELVRITTPTPVQARALKLLDITP